MDIRIGCNNTGLQEHTPATLYSLEIDTISSNVFLSLLSNRSLNGFHFLFSLSDANQYEGTVRPIISFSTNDDLKSK
jgi:hypothetical protein